VRRLLTAHMPDKSVKFRVCHRIAGMGSLGRPRYVALGQWEDALIAREAKRLMPSAYGWALGRVDPAIHGERLLARAVRCADPTYRFDSAGRRPWLVRRLAPRCSRIELRMLPKSRDEATLLEAMGRETANLHLGSRDAVSAVRRDLKRRKREWLHDAAKRMAEATIADWQTWTKQA